MRSELLNELMKLKGILRTTKTM